MWEHKRVSPLQHLPCLRLRLISARDTVQPRGSDTENTGQGSKHFPKWVNIWQPKSNEFGDMSIFGHIYRAFVKCFKMKQEVGKFMPLAPSLLPSLSQERHVDGDKTVCQQFGFCQRVGSIAPTLFNVTDI